MKKIISTIVFAAVTASFASFAHAADSEQAKLEKAFQADKRIEKISKLMSSQEVCSVLNLRVESSKANTKKYAADILCENGNNTEDKQIVTFKGSLFISGDARNAAIGIDSVEVSNAPIAN